MRLSLAIVKRIVPERAVFGLCRLRGRVDVFPFGFALLSVLFQAGSGFAAVPGPLEFESLTHAAYRFNGFVGNRIQANIQNWLIPAPDANPGMITMFHSRDRKPVLDLVPWAGEFAGKYLVSAIQTLRMTSSSDLRQVVTKVIADLISSQAADGYLGPFPRDARLTTEQDLWGHYHCMLALLMWHETTGDVEALEACKRAADLICSTFLNSGLRVIDVGSPEASTAIIHSMGTLHRLTGELRYLELMGEIEKDWEKSGDYLQTDPIGTDFFRTAKPKLEKLHALRGLLELYRITGKTAYRQALTNHWWSILESDRRTSGVSQSEQESTANPTGLASVETCGTAAWIALTIDTLQATGDSRIADELERTTYNTVAGAQHPSGRWWTSHTPLNGARESSARSNSSQARPGMPELNCCSVSGPQSLGMLSEWAVMKTAGGFVVNYLGPGMFQGKLDNGTPVAIELKTEYPLSGRIEIRVEPLIPRRFSLKIRIPEWSRTATVQINRASAQNVAPGQYWELSRRWRERDLVTLSLDMSVRGVPGPRATAGELSLRRGPLLLAYDQKHNSADAHEIPKIDPWRIEDSRTMIVQSKENSSVLGPWILLDVSASLGKTIRLCDFASAGAYGTYYRSLLRTQSKN